MSRSTHTYAVMNLTARSYAEVRMRMLAADYSHAIHKNAREEVIDMHGIAIAALPPPPACGALLVNLTEGGDEVVINHPDLLTDELGNGFIVFSPAQARDLAKSLGKYADMAEGRR